MAPSRKYWKSIDDALRLVEKSLDSKQFNRWISKNQDDLGTKYETYCMDCHMALEEHEGFHIWALGVFLKQKLKEVKSNWQISEEK